MGVDDAHFNGNCHRSAAVDRLDEHVSATHLGIDAETLHNETVFAYLGVDGDRGLGEKAAGCVGMGGSHSGRMTASLFFNGDNKYDHLIRSAITVAAAGQINGLICNGFRHV